MKRKNIRNFLKSILSWAIAFIMILASVTPIWAVPREPSVNIIEEDVSSIFIESDDGMDDDMFDLDISIEENEDVGVNSYAGIVAMTTSNIMLSHNSWNPGRAASNVTVNVTSNTGWDVRSNVNWLTISNITPPHRFGNGTFRINVTANTGTQRTGTITVSGSGITRTITVTQAGNTLTLNPAGAWTPGPLGGSRTINVTSTATWSVSSNASWLSITRTGTSSFVMTANANTGTASRTATVTVTGGGVTRTITVTQARATVSVDPSGTWTPGSVGGNRTINVTSNAVWSVSSNASWLTISNITPTNRAGNGSFRISATTNSGTTTRTGTITVTAPGATTRTITVTQRAPDTLTLNPTGAWTPGSSGGSRTIDVNSNTTWSASTPASWLSITRTGTSSFVMTASANTGTASRTATVTVTGGGMTRTITVTQARATVSVDPTEAWTPGSAGGNRTINVTSNAVWSVSSNASWLTISNITPANRAGNGSFRISATTNSGTTERTGTITVTAPGAITRTITVTQRAPDTLTLNPAGAWTTGPSGGNRTIDVNSNTTWSASTPASWLSITRTGTSSFVMTANANTGTASRTATVTVTGGGMIRTIAVTQERATISVDPTEAWTPGSVGGNRTINVTSNAVWNVSSNASWLTISNITPTNRAGNGSFRISATTNSGTTERTGTITVTADGAIPQTITVTQRAPDTLTLSPQEGWTPGAMGGSQTVAVTSNTTWSMSSDVSWLTLTRTGTSSFVMTATPNTSIRSRRTGAVTVTGGGMTRTITVIQEEAMLNLTPSGDWRLGTEGDNRTITVTSNTSWDVSSNESWISISNITPANRVGNGSFRINVSANTGTGTRTGTITVAAPGALPRSIRMTQSGEFWNCNEYMAGFWNLHELRIWTRQTNAPTIFNFADHMIDARSQWRNAVGGMTFIDASYSNAHILAYGGSRADMYFLNARYGILDETGWAGVAFGPRMYYEETINVGGDNAKIYRHSERYPFIMLVISDFTENEIRQITVHELGHVMGYWGHSRNMNHVMFPAFGNPPNVELAPAEIDHIRRIYDRFRD